MQVLGGKNIQKCSSSKLGDFAKVCLPVHLILVGAVAPHRYVRIAKRNGLVAKWNDIWKYYFVASLIVDMKSFIRLSARIDGKYGPF